MKRTVIALFLTFVAASPLRADDGAKFHPIPGVQRAFGRYVVALSDSTAMDDPSAVAAQLVRTYGGRLEIFAQEGFRGFLIAMTPARARLLSNDPRVAWVEEQASVDVVAPAKPEAAAPPVVPKAPLTPRVEWTTGSTFWNSGDYSYDGAGNVKTIGSDTYQYDPFSRLKYATAKTVKDPGIERTFVRTFEYDRYGNMTKIATMESGGTPFTQVAAVNAVTNQLTGTCPQGVDGCFTAAYDGAGNQTGQVAGDGQYRWDALGMMTKANVPGRHEEYVYDANGERVVTIFHGTSETRRYTLRGSDNKVAREFVRDADDNWSWSKDYVYRNGTLLAAYVAGESGNGPHRHYHVDHLGSTRVVTDSAGYKLATHTYWPFGEEVPGSETDRERMKFTGHERDSNPYTPAYDLDYMHARYYGPMVGRFLSVDPVMDVETALRRPQSWNRYNYAFNNPLVYVDPDGRLVNLATMDEKDRTLLISQLRDKTGLDLSYKNGLLVSNGVLKDANGKALGSATARADLSKAISAKKTYYGMGRNDSPSVNMGERVGNHLSLDFADIAKVNTGNNSPATFDAASILLHELSHAFGLRDPVKGMLKAMPNLRGAAVDRDNKIRSELGLPQRSQYLTVRDAQGRYYIPFSNGPVYVPVGGDH